MTKLTFQKLTYLKVLLSVDGIGPGKIRNLLSKFSSIENILNANFKSLLEVQGININLAKRIQRASNTIDEFSGITEREILKLEKIGGRVISIWDAEYPEILKKIYDPPLLIYIKGTLEESDNFSIAVVGTRQPSNYGKIQTEKIVTDLSNQNITIVSGMARGIDSLAHAAALKMNGRTIAVTGSGLDVIYPPENKKLFEAISGNGAVITEYVPGTKPDAVNFPKRNRIISGLTLGTIVIETGINGGAMRTAEFSLDQNREVFAVPGNVGVKQSEGTNMLIQKNGAKLITSAEDVLIELELKLKPIIGKNIPKPQGELNLFEEKILDSLSHETLQIDNIANLTDLTTSDCLVHLLSLEFKGLVKQLPGKMFAKL